MTAKDRKAIQDAQDASDHLGLMLCLIYNPVFKHWFVEFKAPDTMEAMGSAFDDSTAVACQKACAQATIRLGLMGLERYKFDETPTIIVP